MGVSFSEVQKLSDCMIYLHMAAHETIPLAMRSGAHDSTVGITYSPGAKRFDGVAYIVIPRPWIIAHEVGHLLGFDHSMHGLMEAHAPKDWSISNDQVSLAHAQRVRILLSRAGSSNTP